MSAFDFLIIGGGIAGISIASELAARNRVALIEREPHFAYHSTGRSAAMFIESYGPPLIRALTRASRDFFARPADHGFAASDLFRPRGTLMLAGAGDEARLDELERELGSEAGHLIGIDECLRQVPILRREKIAGAYFETQAQDLDVDAIFQGFLRRARERGANLIKGVDNLSINRDGSVWSIESGKETLKAKTIVNAAGAWADALAADLGVPPVGVTPMRRTAVLVDAPDGHHCAAWPAVIDAREQFYFKPDAGKLLLSPADATPSAPCDAQPEDWDIAVVVDRVQNIADLPVNRINHAWAGLRTFASDGLPVIGYDALVPGLFWLAGQGGYGIQTAPAMARLAASLALEEGVPADLRCSEIREEFMAPRREYKRDDKES